MYYTYMNETNGATATVAQPHFTLSILHAAQTIGDQLEDALGGVGLSMAKQTALTQLAQAGEPLTLSELASRLSCVRSNITQLVDRLEADGLVRRVDDPADRRSVRAELTPLGVEKQGLGAIEIERIQGELASRISSGDLASLKSALDALG
jgi:DNA-binding MarR family transcriptional regulator